MLLKARLSLLSRVTFKRLHATHNQPLSHLPEETGAKLTMRAPRSNKSIPS